MDATCAPSQIKYPQDTALLNEARENTEALIDALHTPGNKKPRTYRKRAHKDYLSPVRTRKPGQKKIRKAIGKQLGYLARNLRSIDMLLSAGNLLTARQQLRLETIRKVYEQQKSMYDARNHTVPDRTVSLSQPWLRPIVRGKAKEEGLVRVFCVLVQLFGIAVFNEKIGVCSVDINFGGDRTLSQFRQIAV